MRSLTEQSQSYTDNFHRKVQSILTENKSWGKKYKALVGAMESANPEVQQRAMRTFRIMDNQAKYLEGMRGDPRLEATFSNALGALVPKVLDLVRIFYPNLVSQELVDIQPMDRQNGEVFIVKPVFDSSAAGVTAGQQVFKNVTDGTYASERTTFAFAAASGTQATITGTLTILPIRPGTVTFAAGAITGTDDGNGNIIGTGISGTINYTTGDTSMTFNVDPTVGTVATASYRYDSEQSPTNIRELDIQLSLVPVTAEAHPLRVKWSTQAQLAAAAHLDLDIPDTLSNLVASFIRQERDIYLINLIIGAATADTNLNFDATPPTNYSRIAKYAEMELKLNYAESQIQVSQGRGGVSWILCGTNAADIWRNCNGFQASDVIAPIGPHVIGSLRDGTVKIIKVPTMNQNTYCMGFKGYVVGDAATILAEWIPLYASPVFQSYDLNNYQGLMSLYATVLNNVAYYRKGTISNYSA
jgi:hypothetical protein